MIEALIHKRDGLVNNYWSGLGISDYWSDFV